MYFLHHLAFALAACIGILLALILSNVSFFRKKVVVYFFVLFAICLVLHVFVFDAWYYQAKIDDDGMSHWEKYIIRGMTWETCNITTIWNELLLDMPYENKLEVE